MKSGTLSSNEEFMRTWPEQTCCYASFSLVRAVGDGQDCILLSDDAVGDRLFAHLGKQEIFTLIKTNLPKTVCDLAIAAGSTPREAT